MLRMIFGPPRELVEEGRRLFSEGATLLDVRTPQEFSGGHVRGALNIPLHELSKRLGELGDKSRPIVVYCRSGGRSANATDLLRRAGFVQIVDVGPMPGW